MTKFEKAKEIIRQGGNCTGIYCEFSLKEECPCSEICKKDIGVIPCPTSAEKKKRIEICEKYLKDNAVEKQIFDKSKVLVAGLHEIDTQMLYIVADNISELNGKIDGDNAFNPRKLKSYNDLYLCERGNTWQFAYPYEEPAKKWRPIKTIEEAETFLGKKIKSKDGKEKMLLTECFLQDSGSIKINKASPKLLFDCYLQEDGSPVGIEE